MAESAGERKGKRGDSAASFGGLSPAEAGRRRWEKERERLASRPEIIESESAVLKNMRKLAEEGTGTTAVQAARYLDERAKEDAQRASDQGLLALLTAEQRACIESTLKGHEVSQAQAIEAWTKESPAQTDNPAGT